MPSSQPESNSHFLNETFHDKIFGVSNLFCDNYLLAKISYRSKELWLPWNWLHIIKIWTKLDPMSYVLRKLMWKSACKMITLWTWKESRVLLDYTNAAHPYLCHEPLALTQQLLRLKSIHNTMLIKNVWSFIFLLVINSLIQAFRGNLAICNWFAFSCTFHIGAFKEVPRFKGYNLAHRGWAHSQLLLYV